MTTLEPPRCTRSRGPTTPFEASSKTRNLDRRSDIGTLSIIALPAATFSAPAQTGPPIGGHARNDEGEAVEEKDRGWRNAEPRACSSQITLQDTL